MQGCRPMALLNRKVVQSQARGSPNIVRAGGRHVPQVGGGPCPLPGGFGGDAEDVLVGAFDHEGLTWSELDVVFVEVVDVLQADVDVAVRREAHLGRQGAPPAEAIALAASGRVPLDKLVGARLSLEDAEKALHMGRTNPAVLKTIVAVSG